MKIISTNISESPNKLSVKLVMADMSDLDLAEQSIVIHMDVPVRQSNLRLAVIQKAILQSAQDVISGQIAAIESALNQD